MFSPESRISLNHLDRLESESIHIFREVVAECRNPVMLYSIGKDSAVMLHLAMKAFKPGKLPFPLLHVDTTWKFRDMIRFRDEMAKKYGIELLVHINQEGVERGIGPISHGSELHTEFMKTEALKQALNKHGFDAFSQVRLLPADRLEQRLHSLGKRTYLLDGDNVRHGLNKDLGFTDQDRVDAVWPWVLTN